MKTRPIYSWILSQFKFSKLMIVFKSLVNNTCQEIKHLANFTPTVMQNLTFYWELRPEARQMHSLEGRINFDFSKDSWRDIFFCTLFILLCLSKLSKTETFSVFKVPHILNLCSMYKLHVKLNYKGFLKVPLIVNANWKRGKSAWLDNKKWSINTYAFM